MTTIPSYTFAGGVLSKSLWGRYDLNKYQTGLKKAENAVLSVEGGVKKRWGTYFTGYRKLEDSGAKLIPWRIADDDSYMLEFGHNYIRFIRFGGYVAIPGGWVADPDNVAANVSGFMEVATPWSASIVRELKYTFANDIMYIVHKSLRPRQLQRLSLYDWNLIEQDFDPHPDWFGALNGTYHDDTTVDDNYDAEPVPTKYKVSATLPDGRETKASSVETVNADLGHRRTRVDLNWPDYGGAIQYTVYKGANGIFGFIGYTETSDFTDRNFAPSYEVVPIGDGMGFGGGGGLGAQNPSVIEFYKQRMVYAASGTKPQDLWFSRPFIFNSLTKSVPLQDDDAFQLPLVGRQRHTINHMIMLKKFLIFTDSAEWTMNTVENRAMSAATADPVIETYYGADPILRPMPIGNRILFVQNKTGDILDMGYEYTADAFKADNLSRLVQDLFKNKNIVAWDYSTYPENLLFCVLDDGTLAIMTYVREHEIWGWTTASTKGKFTDVACVSEIDQDAVYFQVERIIEGETQYFIERYEVSRSDSIADMIFSDCALTSAKTQEGIVIGSSSSQWSISFINGGTYSVGQNVMIESEDSYWMGEITEVLGTIPKVIRVIPYRETAEFPEEFENNAVTVSILHDEITGADHLEGETIWALADGKVYKDIVVVDGGFTLPSPAAHIHFGIPYSTQIKVLDIDADPLKAQFKEKTVHEVTLNVKNTRGVRVGVEHADYDLEELVSRNSETNMYLAPAPLNGAITTATHISWGTSTEIVIESDNPLPMEILNIAPDIRYAG